MLDLREDKYYVFCVNFTGMILANYLECQNKKVKYLDNDRKKWNTQVVNQWCLSPYEAETDITCIIAATNPNSQSEIRRQLIELGFSSIFLVDDKWKREWVDSYAPKMDDELYLRIFWYMRMGYNMDFENPITFNEKIQWLKLHDRRQQYTEMTDKYEVKRWVGRTIGEEYVVPAIGVYDSFDDIDTNSLPSQFVLKCTHDSGGTMICRNKRSFDWKAAQFFFQECMNRNYFYCEREWSYKNIKARILAEELLVDKDREDVLDYKFFCFDGEPKLIQVDIERSTNHRRNLYSVDWKYIDASIGYPSAPECLIKKPGALQEMLECARKLSKGIPHVRVDMYYVNSKVYFGEMTFYHGGGYEHISPPDFEYKLGKYITSI